MRHPSKFAVHILRALVNANPTFCMAFIAILAITLAGITINALVTITLATINERQCAVHQLKYTQLPHHANQFRCHGPRSCHQMARSARRIPKRE